MNESNVLSYVAAVLMKMSAPGPTPAVSAAGAMPIVSPMPISDPSEELARSALASDVGPTPAVTVATPATLEKRNNWLLSADCTQ